MIHIEAIERLREEKEALQIEVKQLKNLLSEASSRVAICARWHYRKGNNQTADYYLLDELSKELESGVINKTYKTILDEYTEERRKEKELKEEEIRKYKNEQRRKRERMAQTK